MDSDLRNGLWNAYCLAWPKPYSYLKTSNYYTSFYQALWHDFFKWPVDEIPFQVPQADDVVNKWFFAANWELVYDFIEFLIGLWERSPYHMSKRAFPDLVAEVLERELSAYRLAGTQLVEITDDNELATIEEALATGVGDPFTPVRDHLSAAAALAFDRKSPDYRNSIKESISAVESAASITTGLKKPDLKEALAVLRKEHGFHPAMEKAFNSLYGYTSDEEGIRHAMMAESDCDFHDAKYMLVACSAFVNYLAGKSSQ